jgi:hypothetical protein
MINHGGYLLRLNREKWLAFFFFTWRPLRTPEGGVSLGNLAIRSVQLYPVSGISTVSAKKIAPPKTNAPLFKQLPELV